MPGKRTALLIISGLLLWTFILSLRRHEPPAALSPKSYPINKRLLIIAPHPDDEILGGAALILKTIKQGGQVHVILVTDGDAFRAGVMRWYKTTKPSPSDFLHYAKIRRRESIAALGILGVKKQSISFFHYPDQRLRALWLNKKITKPAYTQTHTFAAEMLLNQLRTEIDNGRPQTILLPLPQDAHVDHVATSAFAWTSILQEELLHPKYHPVLFGYLAHRGYWPYPRFKASFLPLKPPNNLPNTTWIQIILTQQERTLMDRSLHQYRTQYQMMPGYLNSFIRTNALLAPLKPWHLQSTWQRSAEPREDTLVRRLLPHTDQENLAIKKQGHSLVIRFSTRASGPKSYDVILTSIFSTHIQSLQIHKEWTVAHKTSTLRVPLQKLNKPPYLLLQTIQTKGKRHMDQSDLYVIHL